MLTEPERVVRAGPLASDVAGGHLVARRLKAHGVTKLSTLSSGHLFPIYDGCRAGIDIVDVRHEQSAACAAEGWAKVTRYDSVVEALGDHGELVRRPALVNVLTDPAVAYPRRSNLA